MNFRFGATSWSSPLPYNSRCSVRLVWPLAHEIIRATIIYCYQGSCFWPVGAFVPSQSRSVEGSGVSRVSPGNRTRNTSSFFFFLYLLLSALSSSIEAKLPRELSYRPFLQFSLDAFSVTSNPECVSKFLHICAGCFFFFFFLLQNSDMENYSVIFLLSVLLRIFNRIIFFFFKDHLEKIIF